MPAIEIWEYAKRSVCQIIHKSGNKVISVGTGFKVENFIITNNHVYDPTKSDEVIIQFKDDDGIAIAIEKHYSYHEFISTLKQGLGKDSWDYAILHDDYFQSVTPLVLAKEDKQLSIGLHCSFLGFPFSSNYLAIHNAIISAKYTNKKNDVRYLQLDASINRGNSGGPLIDFDSHEVIGIVTLKHTGFSERFNELSSSFADNIKTVEDAKGVDMQIGPISLLQTIKAIQTQLSVLGKELERSTNVGIGFAFELDEIRSAIKNYA